MAEFKESDHPRDKEGKFSTSGGGGASAGGQALAVKRAAVKDAMRKIAAGSTEVTIPALRDDLEQYGGTNDVTIVQGWAAEGGKGAGLSHIIKEHGEGVIPGVLEAVIDGKVLRATKVGGKVHKVTLVKGDYEAVLSLNEYGKKKTWLLTGFNTKAPKGQKMEAKDALGGDSRFSPGTMPMQDGPVFSPPGLGADASFMKIVAQLAGKSRFAMDAASKRHVDGNGWFEVDANPISKVGVFYYSGRFIGPELDPDQLYPVFRPPEELSDPACIESFKLLPWTNDHPSRLLGAADGAVAPEDQGIEGIIGEKVFFDPTDGMLKANIKVFSQRHADVVNAGKKELSAGYHCKYEYAPGVWQGKPYQFVQRQIRGNHLASVDSGRMGPDVSVMDGFRFVIDSAEMKFMKKTNQVRRVMNTLIRYGQDAEENPEASEEEKGELETLKGLIGQAAPLMEQLAALPTIMAKTQLEDEPANDEEDPDNDALANAAQAAAAG